MFFFYIEFCCGKFIIIKITYSMYRQRKKVVTRSSNKTATVVVDSQTDELQEQKESLAELRSKGNSHSIQSLNKNPYEKIPPIPEIQLSKEDMKGDPILLILKLQQKYRDFGAVKIRACPEWQPPYSFKYTQKEITTRIQKIHRLSQGKAFHEKIQQYTIKTFNNFAEDFEKNYKFRFSRQGSNPQAQLENQYWQLVRGTNEQPLPEKYKVTVQYAADLPAHQFGSGFPQHESLKARDEHFNYATSFFNLNNISKAPSSILKICEKNNEKISGITIPWVYMGMMFSTFCWHVQDLWLNSLNYSHKGGIKTWYVIPESDKAAFDEYVLKKTGKRQFLNSITFMIDPLQLMENGIKVYKTYQRPKEYILTLFGAYHCGFSQGFNVGEAVNVGTIESYNEIKRAMKAATLYKNQKPPVICYEWLVSGNVGNPNISTDFINHEYKKIVDAEYYNLKKTIDKYQIKQVDLIDQSQKYDKNSCHLCRHYQYLSLLKCAECGTKYCLEHASKCCGKKLILMTRKCDELRRKTIDMVVGRQKQ